MKMEIEKEKGKHFIVGQDGKMYDPNLIKDKIYDKDKGGYVSKDDEDAEPIKAIENISAILDPKTKLGAFWINNRKCKWIY